MSGLPDLARSLVWVDPVQDGGHSVSCTYIGSTRETALVFEDSPNLREDVNTCTWRLRLSTTSKSLKNEARGS